MIQKILSFFTAIFLSLFATTKNISPSGRQSRCPSGLTSPTPILVGAIRESPPVSISKKPSPPSNLAIADTGPWGVAERIGEHTWTMKIEQDPVMATSLEILQALNVYRRRYGSSDLIWDQRLADYAQSRAEFFNQNQALDSHRGFADFLENNNGFEKLGFTAVGENASYGYRLNGTHLIEWIYAGDEPHDQNQKDSRWAYAGIGVDDTATCLIFATGKI